MTSIMRRSATFALLVTVLIFTFSDVAHAQRFRGGFRVAPKQTEVFVDGFYAGTAGDFGGMFKRLHTTPGGHAITPHLEGYKTVTQNIYVRPGSTFKIQDTMDRLAAGEVSAPVPMPSRRVRPEAPAPTGTPNRS